MFKIGQVVKFYCFWTSPSARFGVVEKHYYHTIPIRFSDGYIYWRRVDEIESVKDEKVIHKVLLQYYGNVIAS